MIFNSISKQLTNSQLRKTEYRPVNYQPAFPTSATPSHFNTSQSFHNSHNASETMSALSQMNQKISTNLQYLRYKDQVRQIDLKMSRISHGSNRSHHSTHSHQSRRSIRSNPKVHIPTESRYSIKTNPQEHYFPQHSVIKPQFQHWKKPIIKPENHLSPLPETNYRQFMRKPITIEQYDQKYGPVTIENKRPEKDGSQSTFKMGSKAYQSSVGQFQHSKTQGRFKQSKEALFQDKYSATTPANREWINSFGDKFPKTSSRSEVTHYEEPISTRRFGNKENEQVTSALSPLPQAKKRKDGMIVAVVLVTLGLVLFVLQTIK